MEKCPECLSTDISYVTSDRGSLWICNDCDHSEEARDIGVGRFDARAIEYGDWLYDRYREEGRI